MWKICICLSFNPIAFDVELKLFNFLQPELIVLDRNTWHHLTMFKWNY